MGTFKTKYNPFSKSLQWVLDANLLKIKGTVDTQGDLPLTGNSENDCYITKDTDRLYTWSIVESSGTLDKWLDVGSSAEIDWSTITNKPSSDVADIDDAVTKKHEQNTDTKLDEGGSNEVSASEIVKNIYNSVLLAFKLAIQGSLTIFNMIDGVVDEYEDESGISGSENAIYDSSGDYYNPSKPIETKLLLHLNGNDGDTSTNDDSESEHIISFQQAELDTSQKKFGTSSCYFKSVDSAYLTIADSEDWYFGSDDFTIDCWVRFKTLPGQNGYQTIWSQDNDPYRHLLWLYGADGTDRKWFYILKDNTGNLVYGLFTSTNIEVDTWYHIALVRHGNNIYMFQDGIKNPTVPTAVDIYDINYHFAIGADKSGQFLNGWIDEFRVSKGIARWTSNFTPPTEEYIISSDNMTLISDSFTAESQPDTGRIVVFEEDVDAITINTDLKAYISRDDGSTWAETTLEDEGDYDALKRVLVGSVDLSLSGIGSGTDMVYKIVTDNEKQLKIHGTALLWD